MVRSVDSIFDEDKYLDTNPDVREALERGEIVSALDHFFGHGVEEERQAFWKVEGENRTYQCDAILIDGQVDVVGQFWELWGQRSLEVYFYIVSNDPDKFDIAKDQSRVTLVNLNGTSPHTVVHELIPKLKTDYIIFSIPYLTDPGYVRSQINRLQNSGREVLVRVGFDKGNLTIIRKNTLLDMGGFRDVTYYFIEDLIQRAKAEERPFDHGELLRSASTDYPSDNTESLRKHAIGYKRHRVESDVIIPFYGSMDFVEESVSSIVEQDNADTVVHLIDDCSREDTVKFLTRWKSHPKLRVYRNNVNVGQFISVNNIVQFLETKYITLLDGDDVSDSKRVWEGVNLIELTKSDLFGSRIKMFGDEYEWGLLGIAKKAWVKRSVRHWNCTYPHEIGGHYFPNTSLIMTKKSFIDIGGFTDFGDTVKNKTANDTDLLYRYFFGGYGTCYSVSNLVSVRRHVDSCTQNSETGWTTPARIWAHKEVERRKRLYFKDRKFIPRSFGGLGSISRAGITQVFNP